ncbi:MAG: hypothetical protein FWD42_07165, partial [Solirubrobacterales bacterium]|nr:hypothetical protein [Solirubrobacterales bacterium]
RRLDIRVRGGGGGGASGGAASAGGAGGGGAGSGRGSGRGRTETAHTLNGTAVAMGRTIIALLENGQRADGSVRLPACLVPYGAPAELAGASAASAASS